jgi:RNA polymerase sigma factor (sigma-70 family)
MNTPAARRVLAHLDHVLTTSGFEGCTDRDLLQRFSRDREEAAFAELVGRHASVVLGVCRRVLHQRQDAEDACQAAFLALARKADSSNWQHCVAPWLYRVAYHLALRLRRSQKSRAAASAATTVREAEDPLSAVSGRELCGVLDEELKRLPESCRSVLVLCCLQGLTRDEAATQLGWSLGTLKRRLARARAILRQRLQRRGFSTTAVLAAGLYATGVADARLPNRLVKAILHSARSSKRGKLPADVPQRVSDLCKSVGRDVARAKLFVGSLLVLSVAALSVCFSGQQSRSEGHANVESVVTSHVSEDGDKKEPALPTTRDRLGDPLPQGAIARLGTERFRLSHGPLYFSADGKTLTAAGGTFVRDWDIETGRERRRFQPDLISGDFYLHCVSSAGILAVVTAGKPIRFWDLRGGREIYPLGKTAYIAGAAALSHDGTRLATMDYTGMGLSIWDLTTGQRSTQIPLAFTAGDMSLAFSVDGQLLAYPLPKGVAIWDMKASRKICQYNLDSFRPAHVAFSPDNKLLAVTDPFTPRGGSHRVHVIETASGKLVIAWHEESDVYQLAFSRDGRMLATGGRYGKVTLREPSTGKLLHACNAHSFGVVGMAFSPDGKMLATSGVEAVIRLWDPTTGQEIRPYDSPINGIDRLDFTDDGKRIISTGSDQVAIWESSTGRPVSSFDNRDIPIIRALAVSPDGKTAAMNDDTFEHLRLWDLTSGKSRLLDTEKCWSYQMAFSPDGKTFAVSRTRVPAGNAEPRQGLCLRDAANGHVKSEITTSDLPRAQVFTRDSRSVLFAISTGRPPQSALYKCRTSDGGEEWHVSLTEFPFVGQIAASPDGSAIAVTGNSGKVLLLDLARGQRIRDLDFSDRGVHGAAFSPDGRTLAVATSEAICLMELAGGRERLRLEAQPASPIRQVCFSPDGKFLASVGSDAGLLWDMTGRYHDGRFVNRPVADRDLLSLWKHLTGEDPAVAYRALRKLAASPESAAPALRKHLQELTRPVDETQLRLLVAQLDSPDFERRRSAALQLERLGVAAERPLRRMLESAPSLEARRGMESVLTRLSESTLQHAERATEALEMMDSDAAAAVLKEAAERAKDTSFGPRAAAAWQRVERRRVPRN